MANEHMPTSAREAKAALAGERVRLQRLMKLAYQDDPDFVGVYLAALAGGTHFELVPTSEDQGNGAEEPLVEERVARDAPIVDAPAQSLGFPKVGAANAGVDDAKPLPKAVFEYVVIGLLQQDRSGAMTKKLLINTMGEKRLDVSNQAAVNTRLNKMKASPNCYIVFDKGKQATGMEVTAQGRERYRELEGNSSKSLTLPERTWLNARGLWFGDPLPEATVSSIRNSGRASDPPSTDRLAV